MVEELDEEAEEEDYGEVLAGVKDKYIEFNSIVPNT
jgi:hypothetical protein